MPEQEQQQEQRQPGVRMPEVSTNRLAADDYVYEPKAKAKEAGVEAQPTASGGMSSQFEIVSSALNKNI